MAAEQARQQVGLWLSHRGHEEEEGGGGGGGGTCARVCEALCGAGLEPREWVAELQDLE
eukprot:COSAG01_NODE_50408_length_363_cov_2.670455_1_plen_58_part_01